MADKKLMQLYYLYGKITYGMAYYSLVNKGIQLNYENLKNEIETNFIQDAFEKSKQIVKSR